MDLLGLFFGAAEGTHDGRELNLQRTQLHVGGNPGPWTKAGRTRKSEQKCLETRQNEAK